MTFWKSLRAGLPLALLLLPTNAPAREAEAPLVLDAVVVTAERVDETYQTGDVDTEETPAFFSVIRRDQFEGKLESLAEVIEKEAGVQVLRTGGLGSYSVVSLRGSTSEQVMIYLDGILLNEASGGGVDLSNISLSDVASIEIYRGISPANFGKASIGGVINIKTLRGRKTFNGNATAGFGSFDTYRSSAFVNAKPGRLDCLLSAEYLSSRNDFPFTNKYRTPYSPEDWTEEKRRNADLSQYNLLGKVGYDLTDTVRLTLVDQWFSKDQGIPRRNNAANETEFRTDRNLATLELIADEVGTSGLNTKTRISHSWKEEEYDDRQGQIGKGKIHTTDTTDGISGNLFVEYLTANNSLSLILDGKWEEYETEDHFGRKNPNESSRETYVIGVQDTLYLLDQRLSLTGAVRYMHVRDDLEAALDVFGYRLFAENSSDDYWMPQLGAKYRLLDWVSLKTNIARYVREPSFFELFGDRGYFSGNPRLDAETGLNYDLGFEIDWQAGSDWLGRVSVGAAWFASDTDDTIIRVFNAAGYGTSKNLSESRIRGIESAAAVDFLKFFRLSANATWQDTENLTDEPVLRGNRGKALPGRFETAFRGRLEARYAGFKAFAELIRETGMYYDEAEILEAPDKDELNAGISWRRDGFQVSLEGRNLEDNQYEEYYRYPLPGRSFSVSVKYDF